MRTSTERILTTHVGSLPRPKALLALLDAQDKGGEFDAADLEAQVSTAVGEAVARQIEAGIDVLSDGEMSKMGYTFYVRHRLSGIAAADAAEAAAKGLPPHAPPADLALHPELVEARALQGTGPTRVAALRCEGPVAYRDRGPLDEDIARFTAALEAAPGVEGFMNAASPGVLPYFIPDAHYGDEDAYVADLADAMQTEYEAIHAAGLILQIDCPDLAMVRHMAYRDLPEEGFLRIVERNVEAINSATRNIPPEAMRMHLCWGNYPGPHTLDIAAAKIAERAAKARPRAILFEGANPRHEHEWEDWGAARIPDDKILVPGVLDSTTPFVEHPRLIAQRIRRYADIVGRERVIAGVDCGFGTFAGGEYLVPSVVYAKLASLAEGARLASEALWG